MLRKFMMGNTSIQEVILPIKKYVKLALIFAFIFLVLMMVLIVLLIILTVNLITGSLT